MNLTLSADRDGTLCLECHDCDTNLLAGGRNATSAIDIDDLNDIARAHPCTINTTATECPPCPECAPAPARTAPMQGIDADDYTRATDDRCCMDINPGAMPFCCTRPAGHPGAHAAHARRPDPVATWPNTNG